MADDCESCLAVVCGLPIMAVIVALYVGVVCIAIAAASVVLVCFLFLHMPALILLMIVYFAVRLIEFARGNNIGLFGDKVAILVSLGSVLNLMGGLLP